MARLSRIDLLAGFYGDKEQEECEEQEGPGGCACRKTGNAGGERELAPLRKGQPHTCVDGPTTPLQDRAQITAAQLED